MIEILEEPFNNLSRRAASSRQVLESAQYHIDGLTEDDRRGGSFVQGNTIRKT